MDHRRVFQGPQAGNADRERRLDEADDFRKRLAFDTTALWRVFDLRKAAAAEPDWPALDFFEPDELATLYMRLAVHGFKNTGAPPRNDLRTREPVVDLGRFAGLIPSKRWPLPGDEKIRKAMKLLLISTQTYRAIKMHENQPGSKWVSDRSQAPNRSETNGSTGTAPSAAPSFRCFSPSGPTSFANSGKSSP